MSNTDYADLKDQLIEFLKSASGADYDAVYYYIDECDFDQQDPGAVLTVAERVLEKATVGKANPYRPIFDHAQTRGLYPYPPTEERQPPAHVLERMNSRGAAEKTAESDHITYVPISEKFNRFLIIARNLLCSAELERIKREYEKSQTFFGQVGQGLKWQLSDPVNNIGWPMIIVGIIVILWVIAELASM